MTDAILSKAYDVDISYCSTHAAGLTVRMPPALFSPISVGLVTDNTGAGLSSPQEYLINRDNSYTDWQELTHPEYSGGPTDYTKTS